MAVIVIIRDADTHAPPAIPDSGIAGNVGEFSVVVPVENRHRIAAGRVVFQRRAVRNHQIGIAVAVVIEEARTVADGFDDVVFNGLAGYVSNRNAYFFCDVDEGRKCLLS